MKYLLLPTLLLSFSFFAQSGTAEGRGTGSGTAPGGTGMSTGIDNTHASPGGLGANPAMSDRPITNTGTDVLGPNVQNQETFPNSGMTRNRTDVTGSGMSNSTHNSSNQDPTTGQASDTFGVNPSEMNTAPTEIPSERNRSDATFGTLKTSQEFQTGPYDEAAIQAEEEGRQQRQNEGQTEEDRSLDSDTTPDGQTTTPLGPNKR